MVKIRVKLRLSSIEGKSGTIYYQVSHRSVVRHIATGLRLRPGQWDEKRQRVLVEDAAGARIQSRIDSDMALLRRIVHGLEQGRTEFSADDVADSFRCPEWRTSVVAFMHEQIEFLMGCNRLGTAVNYRRAAASLSAFLNSRQLSFAELTTGFVEQYNEHLRSRGMVRNSRSFHMRILRAVYNKAVRRGYARQTFPFSHVYTGIDRTRSRAVDQQVILRLIRLDAAGSPSLAFARDMFLFSFYTRGMAFVDMAYLRKSDLQQGIIRYSRRKTGQRLAIRIEPCMREIIDRYAACRSTYVFPILRSDDEADCFRRYKTALRTYNNRLRQLSRFMGLEHHLSSYTSRHSWATAARDHNVPVSVISAGMGHSSERTTQIYLKSLEDSVIDNANRNLLEAIESAGSCQACGGLHAGHRLGQTAGQQRH